MAALTITTPDNTYPLPVENEICYGLLADKYLLDEGRVNFASFIFGDSQPNVNGEVIIIMGNTFTVSDSAGSTPTTWNGGSSVGLINAQFFRDMLKKSFYFADYIIELDNTGADPVVTITSKGNTDIPGWDDIDDTDLSFPIVGPVINGQAPSYVNGYRIMYRPEYLDGDVWCPVCDVWNIAPVPVDADYNPISLDVPIQGMLSKLVKTRLPILSQSSVNLDSTITKRIRLKAGSQQIGSGTTVAYNEFTTTEEAVIINTALQVEDVNGMADYAYSQTGVTDNSARFLTSRGLVSLACRSDYMWFWFYASVQEYFEGEGETVDAIVYKYTTKFYNNAGLLATQTATIANNDGVFIIPAGPKNGLHQAAAQPTATRMEVQVMAIATLDGVDTRDLNVSKKYTIHLVENCCDDTQVFFLSPFGGYDTLSFTKRVGIEISTTMTEICTDDPCGGDILNSGKAQVNGKSFERIVLETSSYQKTEEQRRFFRDFKISESRFILTTNEDGTAVIRRFLIEPGTLRVWQDGEKLRLTVAGYYANELKQQSQG